MNNLPLKTCDRCNKKTKIFVRIIFDSANNKRSLIFCPECKESFWRWLAPTFLPYQKEHLINKIKESSANGDINIINDILNIIEQM